jgi:hypothetical protein
MSKVAISGDSSGTGTFTIKSPNSNSDRTLNLPDNSGTVITTGSTFAGTGPAFSAYSNAAQSVTNNVFTKIQLQVEDFDTAACFDSTTNYRFTPNVAGYYQVTCTLRLNGSGTSTGQAVMVLYKNGNSEQRLLDLNPSAAINSNSNTTLNASALVYMNGSTDYIELYGYYFGGTCTFGNINSTLTNRFSAALVRAA